MSQAATQKVPEGMHTLTPHIVCAGASQAIDFYKKAFSAIELARLPGPGGLIMHAMVKIGDSTLMLVDEMPQCAGASGPKQLGGTPVTLHLYVEDADALFAQAVAAGGKPLMPITEMFWGDRYGQVEDPFGHRWSIATHVRDVSPEDMQAAMKEMAAQNAPK